MSVAANNTAEETLEITTPAEKTVRHTMVEDAIAFATGAVFAALGINMLKHAGLITGGATGMALLTINLSGLQFAWAFALVNIPFFILGLVTTGWRYVLKSAAGMAVVAAAVHWMPGMMLVNSQSAAVCASMGGLLLGVGMLIIIRHGGSVGGLNIFSLWMQERFGLSAGKVQLAVDAAIIITASLTYSAQSAVMSILSVVAINIVLIMNHKKGRYLGY